MTSLCEIICCDPIHFSRRQAWFFQQLICLMQRPTPGTSAPWNSLVLDWPHLQVCKLSILSKLARGINQ